MDHRRAINSLAFRELIHEGESRADPPQAGRPCIVLIKRTATVPQPQHRKVNSRKTRATIQRNLEGVVANSRIVVSRMQTGSERVYRREMTYSVARPLTRLEFAYESGIDGADGSRIPEAAYGVNTLVSFRFSQTASCARARDAQHRVSRTENLGFLDGSARIRGEIKEEGGDEGLEKEEDGTRKQQHSEISACSEGDWQPARRANRQSGKAARHQRWMRC